MKIGGNGKEENQKIIEFIKASLEEWKSGPPFPLKVV
jgi:hypothetical protein